MAEQAPSGEPTGELNFIVPVRCPKYVLEFPAFMERMLDNPDDKERAVVMGRDLNVWAAFKSEYWAAYQRAGRKRKPRERKEAAASEPAYSGPSVDADGQRVWDEDAGFGDAAAPAAVEPVAGDASPAKVQLPPDTRRAMSVRMRRLDAIVRRCKDQELTQTVMEIHTLLDM